MKTLHHFRLNRLLACSLAGLGLGLFANASQAVVAGAQIDMKLLVLTILQKDANGVCASPPSADAVYAILDRIGIPYDRKTYSYCDSSAPTPPDLAFNLDDGGSHAYYQGIILPLSAWDFLNPASAAPAAQKLRDYQVKYGVRMASFYAFPGDTGCLQYISSLSTTGSPLNTTLTAVGKTVFPYMKAGSSTTSPLPVNNAWTYLAGTASSVLPDGTTVTPVSLLQGSGSGQAVMATCSFKNNGAYREILALTFDNNPYLIHSMTLSYGVVNWVTKGIFLGERHAYLDPQPDDIGIPDDIYPYAVDKYPLGDSSGTDQWYDVSQDPWYPIPSNTCPLGGVNPQTGLTPCEYRMTGNDLMRVVNWQTNVRTKTANASAVRLDWPFNGAGFSTKYGGQGLYPNDSLSPAVAKYDAEFKWVSHTYDHELLDPLGTPETYNELSLNQKVRNAFGFANYAQSALVTPEISGLYSTSALLGLNQFGTTYVVSDTSRPTPPVGTAGCPHYQSCQPVTTYCTPLDGYAHCDIIQDQCVIWPLPTPPNSGKYNCTAAANNLSLYEVPRYATALYYNVSQPQEWLNEYNNFYGVGGKLCEPKVPGVSCVPVSSYAQLRDRISDVLLSYLLTYDLRPMMFHQANLRAYDGTHSLLGDLIDSTLAKYNTYYQNLPIRSPMLKDIGDLMKRRQIDSDSASGVVGVLTPGTITSTVTVSAASRSDGQAVVVPVTGATAALTGTLLSESYGGQNIFYPSLNGSSAILTAPAWQ